MTLEDEQARVVLETCERRKAERARESNWEVAWKWMWKNKRDWMSNNVNETAIEWVKDRAGMNECKGKRLN